MGWRRIAWCAWCVISVLGCEQPAQGTQVIVLVDAQQAVRDATATLHLSVQDAEGIVRLDQEVAPRWPVKIALTPKGGDATRLYRVSADARDRTQNLVAWARLASGYVANERRFAVLLLEEACMARACPQPEQTCRLGVCVDATVKAADLGRVQDVALPEEAAGGGGHAGLTASSGGAQSPPPDMPRAGVAGSSGAGSDEPRNSGGTGAGPNVGDAGTRKPVSAGGSPAAPDVGTGGMGDAQMKAAGVAGAPSQDTDTTVAADGGSGGAERVAPACVGDPASCAVGGRGGSAGEGGRLAPDAGPPVGDNGTGPGWSSGFEPKSVVKLPAGNWVCDQGTPSTCVCDITTGPPHNNCPQPQPTCCLTRLVSDTPNCQCWPMDSFFCAVSSNEAWVESCPPKPE